NFKDIRRPSDKTGNHYFEKLRSCENVTLTGRLSHEETLRQISCSRALISTSPMEGFPNVFIEAWACGVPVLSLFVDPGNVIEKEELGVNAHGEIGLLIEALNNIGDNNGLAEKAKEYVRRNHELNKERKEEIVSQFAQIIKKNI
ncbi:MAG: glycosyltransferase, partial [Methanosarcina sp.]|nr:glycosyltransferase [Methanosarcina sp.]